MAVLELDEDDDAGGWDWDGVVDGFEMRENAFGMAFAVYNICLEVQEKVMIKQQPSYRPP